MFCLRWQRCVFASTLHFSSPSSSFSQLAPSGAYSHPLVLPAPPSQSENSLLSTVFSTLPLPDRQSLYAALLPPSLSLLLQTGQNLNTLIKKSPHHSLIPLAFASYTELSERAGEFESWIRAKGGRKENEQGELTHMFRGTCLTSLPGILEETKVRLCCSPS